MTNDVNYTISSIAKETDFHRETIVWREFIFNIESAKSIDAIIKNKNILCAYFGMCPNSLSQYCDYCIQRLFPVYVEKFKNDEIEWHEIEKFKSYCSDESILEKIDQLSAYAVDKSLLNEFIWEYNNGRSETKMLKYLSECKDKGIRTQMLAYFNHPYSQENAQKISPTNKSAIIGHINRQCKQTAGKALLIGYNRQEILRQYGLDHVINDE